MVGKLAIVKKLNKFSANIETEDKLNGKIEFKDISWTKKEFRSIIESWRYSLCKKN